mmetsp:Transcript_44917/g.108313  ORF Transcript_44917/g.108313 Transcript_44917/m.108313 type:complete len:213 (+) Transcript_44917:2151-2789(+)
MPDAARDKRGGLRGPAGGAVGGVLERKRPLHPDVPRFLHGLELVDGLGSLWGECGDLALPLHLGRGAVRVAHGGELGDNHLLEGVEVLPPKHAQCHNVGRVVLVMECQQLLPEVNLHLLGVLLQRVLVPRPELGVGVLLVPTKLQNLVAPPAVSLQILRVLALNCVELTPRGSRREEGRDEKLAENVQRRLKGVLVHAEMVVCVFVAGERIG